MIGVLSAPPKIARITASYEVAPVASISLGHIVAIPIPVTIGNPIAKLIRKIRNTNPAKMIPTFPSQLCQLVG